ncbi:MAG: RluA family pseudouridine synthase [Myxococcota bacterium]
MTEPSELVVPPDAAGVRVDRFLADRAAGGEGVPVGLSRSRLQKLITDGEILVGGARVRPAHKLCAGDRVTVRVPPPEPLDLVAEEIPLTVLFEDEHMIAIAKPAGMVVHPGAGRRSGTLVHALLAHCTDLSGIGGKERPGIVHRLDKETTGVIVVAKHDRAHENLSRQFSNREAVKRYVTFVIGSPRPPSATIDTPYGRHPKHRKRYSSRVDSDRRAVTTYEVAGTGGGVSRVDVLLGTGRTHQIRVHMADSGWPVVADSVYGGKQWRRITNAALRDVAQGIGRHALHAASLEIRHPTTDEILGLEAPLPEDMEELDAAMRAAALRDASA